LLQHVLLLVGAGAARLDDLGEDLAHLHARPGTTRAGRLQFRERGRARAARRGGAGLWRAPGLPVPPPSVARFDTRPRPCPRHASRRPAALLAVQAAAGAARPRRRRRRRRRSLVALLVE
jgi:hypothetical protein